MLLDNAENSFKAWKYFFLKTVSTHTSVNFLSRVYTAMKYSNQARNMTLQMQYNGVKYSTQATITTDSNKKIIQ